MNSGWAVRPVRSEDGDALFRLALAMGAGMTTFPADREALEEKIAASIDSFAGRRQRLDAHYLLVLEDLRSDQLLGTAAVYASVGHPFGFFSYKRIRLIQRSRTIGHGCDVELLTLANDYTGTTEVGTLAVRPELKGSGAGPLLARSRYLLIAAAPDLFAPLVMAEMRGWQDRHGSSPFWDAVGAHFFSMDFPTADRLSALRGSDFISELLPKHPIYIGLLPKEVRDVIGRPHDSSAPAMAMLRREGFRHEGYVDVFDAGPQVHVERDTIATIRNSRRAYLAPKLAVATSAGDYLVSSDSLGDFWVVPRRAVLAGGELMIDGTIPSAPGEAVRACPVLYEAEACAPRGADETLIISRASDSVPASR